MKQPALDPKDHPVDDIRQEVASVVADPAQWLNTENDQLGGRKPEDLIGTVDEHHLRNLIRAIKHGMPS
jgi:Antitoxin Xre/MbcA/ParS C-terminal toxin-binding domain